MRRTEFAGTMFIVHKSHYQLNTFEEIFHMPHSIRGPKSDWQGRGYSYMAKCPQIICHGHAWLSKADHGLSNRKDEILVYLRNIATSASKHMLDKNIQVCKESEIWKQSRRLQQYFTEYWQLHIQVK